MSDVPTAALEPPRRRERGSGARLVAVGILVSRVAGLVREKAFAWFFGVSPHADVLRYAFRAPNVLQNLLGEQTLSAAFIPVYSRLLAEGRREEAGRFAGAIFALLALAVTLLVVVGVLFAPQLVSVLSAGLLEDAGRVARGELEIDRLPLVIAAVRILFPMTGLLVLSAWALGVLNSHRRFLLPYLAPIAWNSVILVALFWASGRTILTSPGAAGVGERTHLLFVVCWAALAGGLLQLGVQLPLVFRLMRGFRLSLSMRIAGVRESLSALGPALAGRGVVQISAYVDQFLASFLAPGAPSAVGWAVLLVNLPLGVFGMSVAAAELPELARAVGGEGPDEAARRQIAVRVGRGLEQMAFVICPAVVGLLAFGYLVAGLVYQGGRFSREDNWLVYWVVCGYTTGLLASTLSRLVQNTFFALRDTRTPAKVASVRLFVSAILGAALMLWLDHYTVGEVLGESGLGDLHLGAVGLGLAAGLAGWVELFLLRRALRRRLPELRLPAAHMARRLLLAAIAALPAAGLWLLLAGSSVPVTALLVLPVYGATYLGLAWWLRLPDLGLWLGRLRRR